MFADKEGKLHKRFAFDEEVENRHKENSIKMVKKTDLQEINTNNNNMFK